MRIIIISFCLMLLIMITGVVHFSIISKNSREQELKLNLDNTIEETLEHLFIHRLYDIHHVDELMADFCTSFMLRQNANANITIHLIGVDLENGLISIEVESEFIFPNGKVKTIASNKTVILEEDITD